MKNMTIMESGGRENFQPRLASPLSTPDSLAAPKTKTGEGLLANAFLERFCALFFSILMPGCRTCQDFAIGGKEKRKKAKSNKVAGLEFLLLLLLLRGRVFSPFPPPPRHLSRHNKRRKRTQGERRPFLALALRAWACAGGGAGPSFSLGCRVSLRASPERAHSREAARSSGAAGRESKKFSLVADDPAIVRSLSLLFSLGDHQLKKRQTINSMFWRVTSLAQSPVEAILDRGEFTLADLLDEDDVIQEARALNGRLVSFLSKRETVRQLVDYIVEPPPAGAFWGGKGVFRVSLRSGSPFRAVRETERPLP